MVISVQRIQRRIIVLSILFFFNYYFYLELFQLHSKIQVGTEGVIHTVSILDPVKLKLLSRIVKNYLRRICEFRRSHRCLLCILCGSSISIIVLCGLCYSSEYLYVITADHLPRDYPVFLNLVYSKTNLSCHCTILHIHTKTLQKKNTHTNIQCQCYSQRNGSVCLSCNRGSFSLEQIYWTCPAFCLQSAVHLNNKSALEQKAVIEMTIWKNSVIRGLILKHSLKQASFCSVELRFLHLLHFCLLWMASNMTCDIHYIDVITMVCVRF